MQSFAIRLVLIVLVMVAASNAFAKVKVVVSIPPLAFLAQRVGGEQVEVHTLVKKGGDIHNFEPSPKDVASLRGVEIYFTMGLALEKTLAQKLKAGDWKFSPVDCTVGIPRRSLKSRLKKAGPGQQKHADRASQDPHVWLNPLNTKIMATHMARAFKVRDRNNAKEYDKNLRALASDILMLHHRIRGLLAPFKGRTLLVYHPALGYFADVYGLKQLAIESEGKEPGPKALAQVVTQAKQQSVKAIFVQPSLSPQGAQAVGQALGAQVVALDLFNSDYLRNMNHIAETIARTMR